MKNGLLGEALKKLAAGVLAMGALLFPAAGTLRWTNGWILMGILFVPMLIAGFVMYFRAPDLLRSRLDAKETQGEQKTVILLSGLMFVAAFVLAGLDARFGWTRLPKGIVIAGIALFLLSYAAFAEVLRENAYLSRTIRVAEGQKVVDTGLYGIVRHPMYAATVGLFLAMPLVLGSLLSFFVMLFYPLILRRRILNEEEVLRRDLAGYADYMKKVRFRLLPFVW